jgi:protein TonB
MSHLSSAFDHPTETLADLPSPILFHSLVVTEPEHHSGRATTTALGSVTLHALLIAAVLVLPLLYYDAVPEQEALRAFFVTPLEVQPPPPPPPPPPSGARPAVRPAPPTVEAQTTGFTAPIDVPSEILPEEGLDLGVPGGVPGGVEGGVPGGVVGGVVGGLPTSPAPPPPEVAPIRVGGHIKPPVKLKDVMPAYPEIAKNARVQGVVILECIISPRGTVTDVKVLRGVPLLDQAAVDAVRQWAYTPTLLNGVPVPVVMTITVRFDLTRPGG